MADLAIIAAAVFAFSMAVLAAERMSRLDRVPFSDDREEDRGLDFGALMAGALARGLVGASHRSRNWRLRRLSRAIRECSRTRRTIRSWCLVGGGC